MDRLIYTAMSGANAATQRQAVLANNLANASSNGFRAELSSFRAVPLRGEGLASRVFALESTTGQLDTPGPAQATGRNLDAMVQGQSWFTVQALDGTEAYTRHGAFEISVNGNLQTSNGLSVLSDAGALLSVPEGAALTLGVDGSLSAKVGNLPASTVGRLKLVTPDAADRLQRSTDGLFRSSSGDPVAADPNARLQPGVLEGSNVNTIETMVGMIQTARQFEVQMKLLQTAESNDKSASQLLGLQA